ncbi:hypothetical protein ACFPH6_46295 [Streptomyces xiangluensis]|uniref:Uncharacterized protein n=1 Tax=Streptomyces xiangluensis TaxID=2665720 RepID=A0ABV8Z6E3_9ACTN
MLEPRPVALRIAPVKIDSVLTERDNRAPAPPRGKRPPARALPAPARRVPPKARNLPRRSGY